MYNVTKRIGYDENLTKWRETSRPTGVISLCRHLVTLHDDDSLPVFLGAPNILCFLILLLLQLKLYVLYKCTYVSFLISCVFISFNYLRLFVLFF
jgi:hypothetical protein